jgi:RHS repeat-associated protein
VVEVRKDGDPEPIEQYVWDVRYVDAPVVRWHDLDDDGTFEDANEVLYYTNDANMNVTALVNTSGTVVERYVYDPYGKVTIYDPNWDAPKSWDASKKNEILYCGYRGVYPPGVWRNPETGLFHVRLRMYHPTLGQWTVRDLAGYRDGMGLYGYVRSRAVGYSDPLGLMFNNSRVPLSLGRRCRKDTTSTCFVATEAAEHTDSGKQDSQSGLAPLSSHCKQDSYGSPQNAASAEHAAAVRKSSSQL